MNPKYDPVQVHDRRALERFLYPTESSKSKRYSFRQNKKSIYASQVHANHSFRLEQTQSTLCQSCKDLNNRLQLAQSALAKKDSYIATLQLENERLQTVMIEIKERIRFIMNFPKEDLMRKCIESMMKIEEIWAILNRAKTNSFQHRWHIPQPTHSNYNYSKFNTSKQISRVIHTPPQNNVQINPPIIIKPNILMTNKAIIQNTNKITTHTRNTFNQEQNRITSIQPIIKQQLSRPVIISTQIPNQTYVQVQQQIQAHAETQHQRHISENKQAVNIEQGKAVVFPQKLIFQATFQDSPPKFNIENHSIKKEDSAKHTKNNFREQNIYQRYQQEQTKQQQSRRSNNENFKNFEGISHSIIENLGSSDRFRNIDHIQTYSYGNISEVPKPQQDYIKQQDSDRKQDEKKAVFGRETFNKYNYNYDYQRKGANSNKAQNKNYKYLLEDSKEAEFGNNSNFSFEPKHYQSSNSKYKFRDSPEKKYENQYYNYKYQSNSKFQSNIDNYDSSFKKHEKHEDIYNKYESRSKQQDENKKYIPGFLNLGHQYESHSTSEAHLDSKINLDSYRQDAVLTHIYDHQKCQERIAELQEKITELQRIILGLERKETSSMTEILEWQAKSTNLQEKLVQEQKKTDQQTQQIQQLKGNLTNAQNHIRYLEQNITTEFKQYISKLEEQLSILRQTYAEGKNLKFNQNQQKPVNIPSQQHQHTETQKIYAQSSQNQHTQTHHLREPEQEQHTQTQKRQGIEAEQHQQTQTIGPEQHQQTQTSKQHGIDPEQHQQTQTSKQHGIDPEQHQQTQTSKQHGIDPEQHQQTQTSKQHGIDPEQHQQTQTSKQHGIDPEQHQQTQTSKQHGIDPEQHQQTQTSKQHGIDPEQHQQTQTSKQHGIDPEQHQQTQTSKQHGIDPEQHQQTQTSKQHGIDPEQHQQTQTSKQHGIDPEQHQQTQTSKQHGIDPEQHQQTQTNQDPINESDQNWELKEKIVQLTSQLQEQSNLSKQHYGSLLNAEQYIYETEKKVEEMANEINNLHAKIAELTQTHISSELSSQLMACQADLAQARSQITYFKEEKSVLTLENSNLKVQLANLNSIKANEEGLVKRRYQTEQMQYQRNENEEIMRLKQEIQILRKQLWEAQSYSERVRQETIDHLYSKKTWLLMPQNLRKEIMRFLALLEQEHKFRQQYVSVTNNLKTELNVWLEQVPTDQRNIVEIEQYSNIRQSHETEILEQSKTENRQHLQHITHTLHIHQQQNQSMATEIRNLKQECEHLRRDKANTEEQLLAAKQYIESTRQ